MLEKLIATERRARDFIAFVPGNRAIWEAGQSPEDAMSKLMVRLPETDMFQVQPDDIKFDTINGIGIIQASTLVVALAKAFGLCPVFLSQTDRIALVKAWVMKHGSVYGRVDRQRYASHKAIPWAQEHGALAVVFDFPESSISLVWEEYFCPSCGLQHRKLTHDQPDTEVLCHSCGEKFTIATANFPY